MISEEDILLHLDEILANEESGDEFIDDIDFDADNENIEEIDPVATDSPCHNHSPRPDSSPIVEIIVPVNRVTKTPLQTPNLKWKTKGKFKPKEFHFDSSKCGVQKHEFDLNGSSSELDFFEAFVSEFLLGKIAFETNRYAKQCMESNETSTQSRINAWKETNIGELYRFLATTLLMARNKKLDMKDYWSTDPLLDSPIFRQIMPRNRYLLLHQMLHFCNNGNQEKGNRLFKLDVVLNENRNNFRSGMVPFQNIVIDESIVPWKGKLNFKQFIKSKRHRFGIKLFVLCDVETDFILDFIIYTGAETKLHSYNENIGKSGAVVKTLIASYLNKGYNLYTDNWYTSPILPQYLYPKKTTLTGTVRKNRRGMPVLQNKLAVGKVQSAHTKNIMVMKWLDRREVFMLSTKFDSSLEDSGKFDRKGVLVKKPICVTNYNKCMGSIDKTDMLLSSVECIRKTSKWYKKLFFHLIDLSLLNSFSTFKTVTGQNTPLAKFQLEVIRQLLEKYGSYTKSPRGRPSVKDQPFRLTARHFPSDVKKIRVR